MHYGFTSSIIYVVSHISRVILIVGVTSIFYFLFFISYLKLIQLIRSHQLHLLLFENFLALVEVGRTDDDMSYITIGE